MLCIEKDILVLYIYIYRIVVLRSLFFFFFPCESENELIKKDLQFNRPQQLRQDYFSFAAMIVLKLTPFKEGTFSARIGGLNYIAYIRCKRKNQSINQSITHAKRWNLRFLNGILSPKGKNKRNKTKDYSSQGKLREKNILFFGEPLWKS